MNTQIVFKTDKTLKDQAMKKAQLEGLTLKAVLSQLMKYYVEGKLSFGIQMTEEAEVEFLEVSPSQQKKMNTIADLLGKI
jgi:hypothetical protein